MHGDNNSWFRDQRARDVLDRNIFSGEAVEMVVVSPNAGGGDPAVYQNGYFNMPGWEYEDFFFNELMPYVEKRYRAGGSKKMRAVAGLSMGGGGTTGYAQHHPDKFCAAYAMSALMDIPKYGAVPSKSPDDKIARLTKSVQDNSCVRHVADRKRLAGVGYPCQRGAVFLRQHRHVLPFRAGRRAEETHRGGHVVRHRACRRTRRTVRMPYSSASPSS